MALGAGNVTPLQMAGAYSVFANGGYRVNPYLIQRVVDSRGKVLSETQPQRAGQDAVRVLDARTAFIADSMLREVVRSGTAHRLTAASLSDSTDCVLCWRGSLPFGKSSRFPRRRRQWTSCPTRPRRWTSTNCASFGCASRRSARHPDAGSLTPGRACCTISA